MAEIKSLFDIITTKEIKDFVDRSAVIKNKKPHILERFFPVKDRKTLTVEWLKRKVTLSRVLNASTFDSDVPLRGYKGIESAKTQMAYFNEGQMVGENDLEKLHDVMQMNPNSPSVIEFIRQTFERFTELINGAYDTPEYMRAGLITNASFTASQANEYGGAQLYSYNYDVDGTWVAEHITPLTGTDAWSDTANSDPLNDIDAMAQKVSQKGLRIVEMIMGSTTYTQFRNNAKIRTLVSKIPNIIGITPDVLNSIITQYVGYSIKITVDDESFMNTDDTTKFYYPQAGCVSFICRPELGITYFGLTPEEIAKDSREGQNLDVTRLERGIVISTEWKKKPVQKTLICSMITLPTFDFMDAVYNLKWATSATQYTLTYNANGGSGTVPSAETKDAGSTTTVAAGTGLTKGSDTFSKWNTEADGSGTDYNPSSTFTFNGNQTLYAIYA